MNKPSETQIDELLTRSISSILPSRAEFKNLLLSGKRLRFYIGADPTGPDLHIGHATNFILLEKLRKLGHEIIILFGDFTAMIGDPTDKEAARVALTIEQVEKNMETWVSQVQKVLSIDDEKNPVKIVRNAAWLSKLSFEEIIKLASHFTVQQMIERDMFEKRMKEGKPVYLHEFFYPLMVGYDSVVLDVDVEVGGNDQTFNMLAGRTLQKQINNKEKFVIATTLLINPKTNKKFMNKSQGGYIGLTDSPTDMFGKVMALPDEAILPVFTDCTDASLAHIEQVKKELESGKNPKEIKMQLATTLVAFYHTQTEAEAALQNFNEAFVKGGIASDAKEVTVKKGEKLADVLLRETIVSSKTDFKRLVGEGAVGIVGGEKITDINFEITQNTDVKIGKHRFLKIKVS